MIEMKELLWDLTPVKGLYTFDAAVLQQEQTVSSPKKNETDVLARACVPATFAVRSGLELWGPETGGLGSIRVAQDGVRNVALFHADQLLKFMHAEGEAEQTLARAQAVVTSMTAKTFEKFKLLGGRIWKAAVSPHEGLVVPMGMLAVECIGNVDVAGHKVATFVASAESKHSLMALRNVCTDKEEQALYDRVLRLCGWGERSMVNPSGFLDTPLPALPPALPPVNDGSAEEAGAAGNKDAPLPALPRPDDPALPPVNDGSAEEAGAAGNKDVGIDKEDGEGGGDDEKKDADQPEPGASQEDQDKTPEQDAED